MVTKSYTMMARVNRVFRHVGFCLFAVSMLLPGVNLVIAKSRMPGYVCAGVSLAAMFSPNGYLNAIGLPLAGWANLLVVESSLSALSGVLRRARPFVAVVMVLCPLATWSYLTTTLSMEEKDKLVPMAGFYVWGAGVVVVAATEFAWWWLDRRTGVDSFVKA